MTTYSIHSPHFVAAVIIDGNLIVQSAPILGWCVGKDFLYFRNYAERKGWKIVPVIEENHPTWLELGRRAYELHWAGDSLVRITLHDEIGQQDLSYDELPEQIRSLL